MQSTLDTFQLFSKALKFVLAIEAGLNSCLDSFMEHWVTRLSDRDYGGLL
ncbi:hypothetical protein ACN4EK_26515 [Pantanalinema rosaneae CENA516]